MDHFIYSNRFIGNDHELYHGCMDAKGVQDKYYRSDLSYQQNIDRLLREDKSDMSAVMTAQGRTVRNPPQSYCKGSYNIDTKVLYTTQGEFRAFGYGARMLWA